MIFWKKLWTAIGPLIAAFILVGILFISPLRSFDKPSSKSMLKASSSMSTNILKGDNVKNAAMATGDYLPFFGSSELSRIDAFHPSVLAEKYDRPYTPFLLGAPGTQSLTHFFMLNSMSKEMKNQKIVFIISPQWFVKNGVGQGMFSLFYSPLQSMQWLDEMDKPDENDKYLAKRLLKFSSVKSDTELKNILKHIEEGKELTRAERKSAAYRFRMLKNEDKLFSKFVLKDRNEKIRNQAKKLPMTYDYDKLDKLANELGEAGTNNNEFEISNSFYTNRILPAKKKLKNSQTDFNYVSSPEFGDFQLVLNQIAEQNIDAMFVIPPVNERWSDYTGLSTDMLDTFSKKINEQLRSQGFEHVVDYTNKRDVPYFMQDTIHIGWVGWLNMDTELQKFLKETHHLDYKIDSKKYLSNEWRTKYNDSY
ncbi:D-alanyl-lipoteichoic acid biosynthesis protein DltD [Vagococcus vulneris]|uniref:Protein DltD n=1 Tax=Vagococcus vulneris TaxID=1977869 RepID=A0A429ZZZ2_9ENTE|nr:D-alanyl-lipoteichoic acid biosynthesis protein DltD [Vagococcus vulneris]RST99587.1 D-alanyl-lipoteichoic acid biosynthesis protein DltD [Vagococcus vulneris]